ncbi:MAG: serine/threonine-protein kinase [Myxococcota bacterium]
MPLVGERQQTQSTLGEDDTAGIGDGVVPRGELARIEAAARGRLFGGDSKPPQIGRFEVIERLGSGGMGVVYAARDPDLDRTVAVKVVRGPKVSSQARSRVLREAQAIARIQHPNVIHVYETGTHGDEVYLAMEYVEGVTLGAWLAEGTRTLDDVLRVFRAAGRGLAAAHAAGVMHRDFKPDNVLVDTQGRVRVLDFGLARGSAESEEREAGYRDTAEEPSLLASPITATGSLMGTPAYMSPEQAMGKQATLRADQFSFCVALWEAAYGQRPWASHEGIDLIYALREATPPDPPPSEKTIPRRMHRVLLRGLQHRASDRFETMDALLAALPPDSLTARRRHWQVAGFGTLGVLGVGATYLAAGEGDTAKCPNAGDYLKGIWDADARADLEATFREFDLSYIDVAWERTSKTLDEYADEWVIAYSTTCDALVQSEERDPLLLEQGACLRWRLQQLNATVGVLHDADAQLLGETVQVLSTLGPIAACEDPEAMRNILRLPDDPQTAKAAQEIRIQIAQADAYAAALDFDASLELATAAVEQARELGDQPVLAEALVRLGSAQNKQYSDQGEAALREAIEIAAASGHNRAAADAWLRLAESLSSTQSKFDEAVNMMSAAEFAFRQSGGDPRRRAALLTYWAGLETARFNFDAAEAKFVEAEALLVEAGATDSPGYAQVLSRWSGLAQHQMDFDRSHELAERALELTQQIYGPGHAKTTGALVQLASANMQLGRLTEARALYESMLTAWSTVDAEDRSAAFVIDLIGVVDEREGKFEDALRRHKRALEIREAVLVPNHPETGASHHNLGNLLVMMGRNDEARGHFERAISIERVTVGEKHAQYANSMAGLSIVNHRAGNFDDARKQIDTTIEIYSEIHGPDSELVVGGLVARAAIEADAGDLDAAISGYRRALALGVGKPWPQHLGDAEFGIAKAQALRGDAEAEIEASASKAAQYYEKAGDQRAGEQAKLETWRASR